MTIIILQILLGAFFTGSAAFKLIRHPHMIKEFAQLRVPYFWALASGAIEIFAGPGLIAGIWWPAVAGIAAIFMTCVMAGAAYANFTRREPKFGFGVLGLMLACLLIALFHPPALFKLASSFI